MLIENWFSTPILYHDFEHRMLEKIQSEIEEVIPTIMEKDLSNPWSDNMLTSFKYSDNDKSDIGDYSLTTLNEQIEKYAKIYYPEEKLHVFQSWFNFSYKGHFQFDHSHTGVGNGRVSGVYYYKTNGEDGKIEFSTPVNFNPPFSSRVVKYKPRVGRLILFPAWLMHKVHINKTESVRISISFNLKS
jgi:uncharacterized protein (TIGR02466 family)